MLCNESVVTLTSTILVANGARTGDHRSLNSSLSKVMECTLVIISLSHLCHPSNLWNDVDVHVTCS